MQDLIYRQDAIDAVNKAVTKEVALLVIKDLPSVQPWQWIPCSRKVPEEKGMYLTTTMNKEVYCDYWNGVNFNRTELVIAWMLLPEPAKLGDD